MGQGQRVRQGAEQWEKFKESLGGALKHEKLLRKTVSDLEKLPTTKRADAVKEMKEICENAAEALRQLSDSCEGLQKIFGNRNDSLERGDPNSTGEAT